MGSRQRFAHDAPPGPYAQLIAAAATPGGAMVTFIGGWPSGTSDSGRLQLLVQPLTSQGVALGPAQVIVERPLVDRLPAFNADIATWAGQALALVSDEPVG